VIILEGPDGAGKTQLAERLSKDLNIPIEPKVVDGNMKAEVDLIKWAYDQISGWPRAVIYDRFSTISEPIYGPIFKGRIREEFQLKASLSMVEQMFTEMDPIIVWCLPSLATVLNNVNTDPSNVVVRDKQEGVYWAYHWNACRFSCDLLWNYEIDDYNKLLLLIKAELELRFRIVK
jgi:hypothetical protein